MSLSKPKTFHLGQVTPGQNSSVRLHAKAGFQGQRTLHHDTPAGRIHFGTTSKTK